MNWNGCAREEETRKDVKLIARVTGWVAWMGGRIDMDEKNGWRGRRISRTRTRSHP